MPNPLFEDSIQFPSNSQRDFSNPLQPIIGVEWREGASATRAPKRKRDHPPRYAIIVKL